MGGFASKSDDRSTSLSKRDSSTNNPARRNSSSMRPYELRLLKQSSLGYSISDLPVVNPYNEKTSRLKSSVDSHDDIHSHIAGVCSVVHELHEYEEVNIISGSSYIRRGSETEYDENQIRDDQFPQLYHLPRGGSLVVTKDYGNIQFGIPPETIKDCLALGLDVPTTYFIGNELFDRKQGISVAEFEFPIYYNFFVKRRRVKLICTEPIAKRIQNAFQETLIGPKESDYMYADDFSPSVSPECYPHFFNESIMLDASRETMEIGTLVDFIIVEDSFKVIHGTKDTVGIEKAMSMSMATGQLQQLFKVYENNKIIATISMEECIRINSRIDFKAEMAQKFLAPRFGVTMLGASHGFDPRGNTTGFILWLNHLPLLVDPPPDCAKFLDFIGVAAPSIHGIILTHCHADHDAGSFQNILRHRQVKLYTTTTIKNSFVRKYTAITGFEQQFLETLFDFHPVRIGSKIKFDSGALLSFQYSLHTIPCISFVAEFQGKSIAYSADTNYSPQLVEKMVAAQRCTPERAAVLNGFKWNSTVVLHESGVPPIHTSGDTLLQMCQEFESLSDRLFVVHCSGGLDPSIKLLKDMDTLEVRVTETSASFREEVTRNLLICPLFAGLLYDFAVASQMLQTCGVCKLKQGDLFCETGMPFEVIGIILCGNAMIIANSGGPPQQLCTGDTIGSRELAALIKSPSSELFFEYNVIAVTEEVHVIMVGVKNLLSILFNHKLEKVCLENITQTVDPRCTLVSKNDALFTILKNQGALVDFIHALHPVPKRVLKGDILPQPAVIVEGTATMQPAIPGAHAHTFRGISALTTIPAMYGLGPGCLVGCTNELYKGVKVFPVEFEMDTDGSYYEFPVDNWHLFMESYPGILLQMLDQKIIDDRPKQIDDE